MQPLTGSGRYTKEHGRFHVSRRRVRTRFRSSDQPEESAEGTLSVTDALRVFSIRALVAATQNEANTELASRVILGRHSQFVNTDFLF